MMKQVNFQKLLAPHFPFSPRKWPFHYGWMIAGLSVITMLASMPGQTVGVGVFTDFLLERLPFTRVELSLCYMVATIISAFQLPLAGRGIDKWGERVFSVFAAILAGLSLLMMYGLTEHFVNFLTSPSLKLETSFLASFFSRDQTPFIRYGMLMGSMTFVFFLLRFSSQGLLAIVSRNLLGKWFIARRARMATFTGFFISLGFAGSPYFLNGLMERYSTPRVLLGLVVTLSVGLAAFFYVFVRNTPEECDLLPDARKETFERTSEMENQTESHLSTSQEMNRSTDSKDMTLSEVIRTPVFWLLSIALTLQGVLITGFSFHITSIGALSGYPRQEMYSFFPIISVAAIFAQGVFGFWSEKKDIRVAHFGLLLFLFVTGFAMLQMKFLIGLIITLIGLGVSIGNFSLISAVGFASYFGRTHLGAVQGFHSRNVILGTAFAPWLFAWTFNAFGNYLLIVLSIVVLSLGVLIGSFWLRAPSHDV